MSHPFPHSLGLKLPLDWRARADSGRPAGAEDLYGLLAGCGYRFLEFATGPCLGDGEPDLVRGEARACAAAGLAAAMHPYLGGPYNPAHFGRRPEPAEALQAILTAASTLADLTDAPVTVVLHPAEIQYEPAGAAPAALRDELLRRSRLYFDEIGRRLAAAHPGVCVVVEHQVPPGRDEPTVRTGDTCAELLQVVAGTRLPLCWDTGHHILSVERHGELDPPPAEFVQRVRHVHLHDVVDGADHQVVGTGSARLRGYMQLLDGSGFTGTVTLEYAWDAVQSSGGLEQVAREAPDILAGWSVG